MLQGRGQQQHPHRPADSVRIGHWGLDGPFVSTPWRARWPQCSPCPPRPPPCPSFFFSGFSGRSDSERSGGGASCRAEGIRSFGGRSWGLGQLPSCIDAAVQCSAHSPPLAPLVLPPESLLQRFTDAGQEIPPGGCPAAAFLAARVEPLFARRPDRKRRERGRGGGERDGRGLGARPGGPLAATSRGRDPRPIITGTRIPVGCRAGLAPANLPRPRSRRSPPRARLRGPGRGLRARDGRGAEQ